jgi:hypothetical protein
VEEVFAQLESLGLAEAQMVGTMRRYHLRHISIMNRNLAWLRFTYVLRCRC